MSKPANIQFVPQNTPVLDDQGLFVRAWFLLWNGLIVAVNYLLSLDFIFGGSTLTTLNIIPKVTALGTLGPSAVSDDATSIVITSRDVTLTNGKIIKQYNAALALRNLLTHFTDDIVYLDNPDGIIHLRPTGKTLTDGDMDVAGVYMVAAVQVVGPRLSAITAPSITTSTVTQTANATYAANEQAMLNSLKSSVNQLNSDVVSLQVAVNAIRTTLATGTGHGLTA